MELNIARQIASEITSWCFKQKVLNSTICGSIRREKPEVKDIDIALYTEHMPKFGELEGFEILWSGDTKVGGIYKGIRVDVRSYSDFACHSAMMLHLTGSAKLNLLMRRKAIELGLKLNEYGLWERDSEKRIPITAEFEVFERLGMDYLPPTERTLDLTNGLSTLSFEIASDSTDSIYRVVRNITGNWSCECLGYKYRGKCKHISKCMEETNVTENQ